MYVPFPFFKLKKGKHYATHRPGSLTLHHLLPHQPESKREKGEGGGRWRWSHGGGAGGGRWRCPIIELRFRVLVRDSSSMRLKEVRGGQWRHSGATRR
jgi:hypothetical protein